MTLDLEKAINTDKSLNDGAILLPGFGVGTWQWKMYANQGFFDNDKKIKDYTKEEYDKLVYAKPEKILINIMDGEMNSTYEGLIGRFTRQNIKTDREKSQANQKKIEAFTSIQKCCGCNGKRYNETAIYGIY